MIKRTKSIMGSKNKKIVVAVSGGFDPVHVGHIRMFQEAKELGDKLVVILNNDNWLRKKKGIVFMPQKERAELVRHIKGVDDIILTAHEPNANDMSVCNELRKIRPHIFVNGGDRKLGSIPEVSVCEKIGCKMVFGVGHGGKVQSSSWLLKNYIFSAGRNAMDNEDRKKLIKRLKEIGVVRKQPVKLKHGATSGLYIDIKKAYGYPKALNMLCELMRRIMSKRANCVAAAGYGGLPLAAALSSRYNLKLVLVREKPKPHGRNVWIDGYIPNVKDKVWIVDDVFTTGESIRQVMKIIKRTKANVLGCGVVVKRGEGKISVPCKHVLATEELF